MIVQKDLPVINVKIDDGMVAIASDFHYPFQDDKAIEAFLTFVKVKQPELIVLNGDLLDFYRLSKFSKGEGRNPKEEIDMVKELLTNIRKQCPESKIYYPIGNHEARLEKYVYDRAPEIISIVDNFYEILGCKDLGIIGCSKVLINDSFVCKHGQLLGKKSGQSAMKELENSYMSGATGHTHRLAKFITRKSEHKYIWLETGCMCSLKPEYMLDPDWQQGFCTVEFIDSKLYKTTCHEIEDGVIL